jgi:PTH1 family peptidyl-tRNA hydrolase
VATVLVVGLGNPGAKYSNTRHNAGWLLLDLLATKHGVSFSQSMWRGEAATIGIGQHRMVLLKPDTMMNLSGEAVGPAATALGVLPEAVMVVSDEVQLPVGKLKLSAGGSDGGHNGLASVMAAIGPSFARLRIGVGQGPAGAMRDWVLSPFAESELELLAATLAHGATVVDQWAALGGGHQAFGRVVPLANAKQKQPLVAQSRATAAEESQQTGESAGVQAEAKDVAADGQEEQA